LRSTLNLEGQVPLFMSPSDRVGRLYPQAPGSLSFVSHDSQGYSGSVLTGLHMGIEKLIVTEKLRPIHGTEIFIKIFTRSPIEPNHKPGQPT
jgi:hypothetical protein